MTLAIIFPLIVLLGGLAFVGLGGYKSWTADNLEESGRFLRLGGAGLGMAILGIIGIIVANAVWGGEDEVVLPPETGTGAEVLTDTGTVVTGTGELLFGTGSTTGSEIILGTGALGSGNVYIMITSTGRVVILGTGGNLLPGEGQGDTGTGTDTVVVGSGTDIIVDTGAVSIGTGWTTDYYTWTDKGWIVTSDKDHDPHQIGGTGSMLSLPHTGEIAFLGVSYSQNGQAVRDMYVNEKFQINVKVENGDYFVWDIDTSVDSDNDGVADNDYDIVAEDPILTYSRAGTYNLNLTVANADNLSNKTYTIEVRQKAPELNFEITPDEKYPATLYLDARETQFFSTGVTDFVWKVDGREISLEDAENDPVKNVAGWYTLSAVGLYDIECEVRVQKDTGDGYLYQIDKEVEYDLPSILSVEIITLDQVKVVPAQFAFIAHAGDYSSTGLDEAVVENYEWDFGDGTPILSGADKKSANHVYQKAGVYQVSLKITGKGGATKSDSKKVFVSDDGAPIVYFQVEPGEGHRSEVFTFDASDSMTAEGLSELTFTWDFGDDTPLVSGRRVTHRFADLGEHEIYLSATDDSGGPYDGYYDEYSLTVRIVPSTPTADFDVIKMGSLNMGFDGSKTKDPDDNVVEYQWDFGDGENLTSKSSMVQHKYSRSGTYDVYLMVRDADGKKADVTKKVTVN